MIDGKNQFNPNAFMLLQTSDGCQIMSTTTGHSPNVMLMFETACAEYDWLNSVVAYGFARLWTGGVTIDVWQVCIQGDFELASNVPRKSFDSRDPTHATGIQAADLGT